MKYQLVNDYENLMRINRELSDEVRDQFERVKLKLSEEQIKAYTTVGGTPHLDGEYTVFGEVGLGSCGQNCRTKHGRLCQTGSGCGYP